MAVSGGRKTIAFSAAGDETNLSLSVKRVRWVAGGASESGDRCVLVDPTNTNKVLAEFVAIGADYAETYEVNERWTSGVHVLTLDSGIIYVEFQ